MDGYLLVPKPHDQYFPLTLGARTRSIMVLGGRDEQGRGQKKDGSEPRNTRHPPIRVILTENLGLVCGEKKPRAGGLALCIVKYIDATTE